MALYLGIDGGGSGCRAALGDSTGRVLGRGTAGPANIVTDPEGARAALVAAAEGAAQQAGVPLAGIPAMLGLAGANIAGAATTLCAALPFPAQVVSDALIALKGALGDEDGIAAILGTGTVFAQSRAGAVTMIGGWGLVLGDEGGGAWIGRTALSRALHAHDGLLPASAFLTTLLDRMGGSDGAVTFAHGARPADFAALAPQVAEAADDPGAAAVLRTAADWVARYVAVLDPGLPVCLMGGVAPTLAGHLPDALRARLRPARGTALDGALRLARQGDGNG